MLLLTLVCFAVFGRLQSIDASSLLATTLRGQYMRMLLGLADVSADGNAGGDEGATTSLVTLEAFGRMLEWFGPLTTAAALFETVTTQLFWWLDRERCRYC